MSSSEFLLRALIDFSAQQGIKIDALQDAADPGSGIPKDIQERVPLMAMNRIWDRISELSGDPLLGMHFGEFLGNQGDGHFLIAIMKNSGTLLKALRSLIRYHNLMTDIIKPSLSVINGKARLELGNQKGNGKISRHAIDAAMCLIVTVLRKITNNHITFEKVCLTHSTENLGNQYHDFFGIRPLFRTHENSLVFTETELDRSISLSQEEFGSQLLNYAGKLEREYYGNKKFNEKVLLLLENKILNRENFSLPAVAKEYHISVRHMQNKLKQEGVTFRELLETARKKIALHYIKDGETMFCDIAFLLGFSEQSSFNHAFKKWTGCTPRGFKNKKNESINI